MPRRGDARGGWRGRGDRRSARRDDAGRRLRAAVEARRGPRRRRRRRARETKSVSSRKAPERSHTHNAARGEATTRRHRRATSRWIASRVRATIRSMPARPAAALARRGSPCTPFGPAERAAVVQERRADELLVDGERQRGVGGAGVRADLGVAEALLAQGLREVAVGGAVVLADRVHAHRRRAPTRGRAWRRPWRGSSGSRRDRRSGRCRESPPGESCAPRLRASPRTRFPEC